MWKREVKNNITYWSLRTKERHHPMPEAALDKALVYNEINSDLDKYDISYSGNYYTETLENTETLPSGIYKLEHSQGQGYFLTEYEINTTEEILKLSTNLDIIDQFESFKKSEALYNHLGLSYKRAVMLYGPPGTGKTSVIKKLTRQLAGAELVIFTEAALPPSMVKILRNDLRLKLIIFEEFTQAVRSDWEAPSNMLSFLDGEDSLERVFIIATTNYPEKLPENITNRPGRFDAFYKIGYLTREDITTYLNHFSIFDIPDALYYNKEVTIAELKEIVLQVKRDNKTIEQVLTKLQRHKDLVRNEFTSKKKLGFTNDDENNY